MLLQPTKIQITENQKAILEKLSKSTRVKLNLKTRATIILFAVENKSNGSIARTLNSTTGTVRR